MPSTRRIDFLQPLEGGSKGGATLVTTTGVELFDAGMRADGSFADILLSPVTGRGRVSDSVMVGMPSEAMGEMAAACLEAWTRYATPQARRDLVARLLAICETGVDPQHEDDNRPVARPGQR